MSNKIRGQENRPLVPVCFFCIMSFLWAILLAGCPYREDLPDINFVNEQFKSNYSNIKIVVDFLISTNHENIYIPNAGGSMVADLEERTINDRNVIAALEETIGTGEFLQISKRGNTISLLLWKGLQDIGCGVAFSINGMDAPDIQYCTELAPLIEKGWYYYVEDYNSWRTGKRP